MGFFDFFKQLNIDQGIEEYKRTAGAVLLDVRTPQEYQEGHIPESKNVPLQQLDNIISVAKNKDIPLFVYCYSGSRSRQATGILQRMGYSKVNNIGGIAAYSGLSIRATASRAELMCWAICSWVIRIVSEPVRSASAKRNSASR